LVFIGYYERKKKKVHAPLMCHRNEWPEELSGKDLDPAARNERDPPLRLSLVKKLGNERRIY
jgi:hypothetical protein